MFSTWRSTTFAACLAISAALIFLGPSARGDTDERKDRKVRSHSRWSHSRSRHEMGIASRHARNIVAGDSRGARRPGQEVTSGPQAHHRGGESHHRWAMREHGRDGSSPLGQDRARPRWSSSLGDEGARPRRPPPICLPRRRDRERGTGMRTAPRRLRFARAAYAHHRAGRRSPSVSECRTQSPRSRGRSSRRARTQPEVLTGVRIGHPARTPGGRHCDHSVGVRSQRWAFELLQKRGLERLAVADGRCSPRRGWIFRIPGMIVETVGSARIHRRASSGIVIPAGTSGRRASARSTLASRFSGTK